MIVLVTGGGGFLASHLLERLLSSAPPGTGGAKLCHESEQGNEGGLKVRVFDKRASVANGSVQGWAEKYEKDSRVEWVIGDLTCYEQVAEAVSGCQVVFHLASVVDFGNVPKEVLFGVNCGGTENILAACKEHNVSALVCTSSLDVVIGPTHVDGENEDSIGYAVDKHPTFRASHYQLSKTRAEKAVLAEAAAQSARVGGPKLRIAVLRPMGIYGERDPYHIKETLESAREAGSMNLFRVAKPERFVFQHAYAGNLAEMHIDAATALLKEAKSPSKDSCVHGEVFFAKDYSKVNDFFVFMEPYIAAKGYKVPSVSIPPSVMMPIARLSETVHWALGLCFVYFKTRKQVLTEQAVHSLSTTQWFHTDKAERLLGYKPVYSPMEARKRTIAHFAEREDFPQGPYEYGDMYNYHDPGTKDSYPPDHHLRKRKKIE